MHPSKIFLSIESDTKKEEKEIITNFCLRLNYAIEEIVSSEKPDFDIRISDKSIGVEVTKYFSDFSKNGSLSQIKLSNWKKFAEKIREKLIAKSPENKFIYGSIHFNRDISKYRELDTDDFYLEVINLIESNPLKGNEEKSLSISNVSYPKLSRYIESIYFHNTYPNDKYLWWDSRLQSGTIEQNENALNDIINNKNNSSKKYRNGYYQKWLVIYAGGLGLGDLYTDYFNIYGRQGIVQIMSLSQPKKNANLFNSNYFTHIFIWDKFTESIYQLYPYYKKIFYPKNETYSIHANHLPIKDIL